MDRKQFTFYESFKKAAVRLKKKTDRADFYDAISDYALYGIQPEIEKCSDAVAVAIELVTPVLDASRKKASNGKAGGKRKQTESKPEANVKQGEVGSEKEKEKENENEIENEIEIEGECHPPTPLPPTDDVAAVLSDYLNRVNPAASPSSLDELKGYAEQMGKAVCIRAIDIALDSKKANWPYIRAILRDKLQRGVKCLADWDALPDTGTGGLARPTPKAPHPSYGPEGEADRRAREDMERMRRIMQEGKL